MIKMRCQTFCAPLGALPVIAPFRGCASHQFTGGLDLVHTVRHRNRPAAPLVCRSSRIRRSSNAPSAHRASVPSAPASAVRPHPPPAPASASRTRAYRAIHPSRAAPTVPRRPAVHPPHRPHLNSLVHPTKVLKLRTFSFLQSISNFMVSLPNLSKRREGTAVPSAGVDNFPKLGKHFKLCGQLTERK